MPYCKFRSWNNLLLNLTKVNQLFLNCRNKKIREIKKGREYYYYLNTFHSHIQVFYIATLLFLMLSLSYNVFMFAFTFVICFDSILCKIKYCQVTLQEKSNQSDVIWLKAAGYPHFYPSRNLTPSTSSPAGLKILRMRNLGEGPWRLRQV